MSFSGVKLTLNEAGNYTLYLPFRHVSYFAFAISMKTHTDHCYMLHTASANVPAGVLCSKLSAAAVLARSVSGCVAMAAAYATLPAL